MACYVAKVYRDCHVVFRGEVYSVPWHFVGQLVELGVTRSSVVVHHEHQHVCVHNRVFRGRRAATEVHLSDQRSSLRKRSRAYWEFIATAIGGPVGDYARPVFDSDGVLSKPRFAQAIVTHLHNVPESRARTACQRALHYRNFTQAGINNLIRRGIDLVPLPGAGNKLEGPWSHKPRFSRVPERRP